MPNDRDEPAPTPDEPVPSPTARVSPPRSPARLTRHQGGRRNVVKVLMNDEEAETVRQRATRLGVSVPRLLVEAASSPATLTDTERHALYAELFALRATVTELTAAVRTGAPAHAATTEARLVDTCTRLDTLTTELAATVLAHPTPGPEQG